MLGVSGGAAPDFGWCELFVGGLPEQQDSLALQMTHKNQPNSDRISVGLAGPVKILSLLHFSTSRQGHVSDHLNYDSSIKILYHSQITDQQG